MYIWVWAGCECGPALKGALSEFSRALYLLLLRVCLFSLRAVYALSLLLWARPEEAWPECELRAVDGPVCVCVCTRMCVHTCGRGVRVCV